jgi:putative hydrolase of the HAD superfamily
MPRWLLCDYGQVLCTAPPADEWAALQKLAGLPPDDFYSVYWEHRPAYDRGDLEPPDYWAKVLGEAPDADRLRQLRSRDVEIWLHPDAASVEAAMLTAEEHGMGLALFSNAPVEVAAGIDSREWLDAFTERFYSCHLRAIKPERQAYEQVLAALSAAPQDVWFFDDREANVAAARHLGIQAVTFTGPEDFRAVARGG